MPDRPRLTPPVADIRRAVRVALKADAREGELVLVALSGGPDSLALAAATAFEAPRLGIRAGAVVVDHQLQLGSGEVAERAAEQARELGLDPVLVVRVDVRDEGSGPEAAARTARYEALEATREELGAAAVLLGHTLDDQAETVLLGLARGSGGTSLHGMAAVNGRLLRPLLGIRREQTHRACADLGLEPWRDPHNDDPKYLRVRVRSRVLPLLEEELGPGIAVALARTATTLREDAETLDELAMEWAREIIDENEDGRISIDVRGLVAQPPALRQRICRIVAEQGFGVSLSRRHTMAVAALATEWRGQGPVDLPGIRVEREQGRILFGAVEPHADELDESPRDGEAGGAARRGGARQIFDPLPGEMTAAAASAPAPAPAPAPAATADFADGPADRGPDSDGAASAPFGADSADAATGAAPAAAAPAAAASTDAAADAGAEAAADAGADAAADGGADAGAAAPTAASTHADASVAPAAVRAAPAYQPPTQPQE